LLSICGVIQRSYGGAGVTTYNGYHSYIGDNDNVDHDKVDYLLTYLLTYTHRVQLLS